MTPAEHGMLAGRLGRRSLVCHLAGDLLLQTEWQALTKVRGLGDPEGRRALMAHVLTYMLPCLAVLVSDRPTSAGWRGRSWWRCSSPCPTWRSTMGGCVRVWLRQVKHSPNPAPSLRLMVDQSFHVVCLLGVAVLAAA